MMYEVEAWGDMPPLSTLEELLASPPPAASVVEAHRAATQAVLHLMVGHWSVEEAARFQIAMTAHLDEMVTHL